MKRSLIIFMVLILCCITTSCYTTIEKIPVEEYQKLEGEESYTEGDGTANNPYVIDTKGKLIYLSNQTADGKGKELYYELQADINLEGINWNPIHCFKGHFNGNGYEISNFVIENRYPLYKFYNHSVGFFESNVGTIERLGLTNFSIDVCWVLKGMWTCAGGIVGTNMGVIKNCYANGSICVENFMNADSEDNLHNEAYVGGIAGINKEFSAELYGEIYNCYAKVYISDCVEVKLYNDSIAYIKSETSSKNINCTDSGYRKKEYYTNELGWSEDIWDFDNPEFQNGGYLKLKRNK